MKFSIKETTADLVTFTEEILNGKLHFCAVIASGLKKVSCKDEGIFTR